MGELVSDLSVGSDPVRPGDHHRVPGAAEVARHLFAPLERGVVGVGPGGGEVRCGVVAAESLDSAVLLDELQLMFGVEHHPVEEGHFVERTGDGSFHAGAVVAPDVEDQRVVEITQILDRVQQSTDVPVGVL